MTIDLAPAWAKEDLPEAPKSPEWREGEACCYVEALRTRPRRFTQTEGIIEAVNDQTCVVRLPGASKPRTVAKALLYRPGERPKVGTVVEDFLNWRVGNLLNLSTQRRSKKRTKREARKSVRRP
jgi:hypothetical protein